MRLTTLPLIIALVHMASSGQAQITLKEKNAPLEKVLSDIEKQTKYVFLYDPDELKMGPITIDVKNASLQETLLKCFKGQAIEFTVVGNNVLLKRKPTGNIPPSSEIPDSIQQTDLTTSLNNQDIKTFKIYDHAAPGRTNRSSGMLQDQ